MNSDPFEDQLKKHPPRQVPPEWRRQILAAAERVRSASGVSSTPSLWALVRTLATQGGGLLWPSPAAWAGVAAVWLVILGLNLATGDHPARASKVAAAASPQTIMAFQEQNRLLLEIIGPNEPRVARPPRPAVPKPRSEKHVGWSFA